MGVGGGVGDGGGGGDGDDDGNFIGYLKGVIGYSKVWEGERRGGKEREV